MALLGSPASAQTAGGGEPSGTTAKLIQLLVAKGVLSKDQATDLLNEARAESVSKPRPPRSRAPTPVPTPVPAAVPEPVVPPGTVRVTYVPQSVRDQIATEVKQQLFGELNGGLPRPPEIPGWTQRIRISGDLRLRGERSFFDTPKFAVDPDTGKQVQVSGNDQGFLDYQSINSSANGYDDVGSASPPTLNTRENRTRFRVRARLDVAATISEWLDADLRVGTGNDTSPVSLNQTFGQPGNFSKYNLWLDRAYLRFKPTEDVVVDVGRAPNPFWTSNLLFSDNVNFDGLSAQGSYAFNKDISVFASGGAFPVYNTNFNFGTATNTQTSVGTSYPSRDAYLFAAQGGAKYNINDDYEVKGAFGYFNFSNVRGKLSSPCGGAAAPSAFGSCNTDNSRTSYVQYGNTVFPIRNIVPEPGSTKPPNPQFYGLASQFNLLDLHGSFTIHKWSPIDVVFDFDYVKNLGFSRRDIIAKNPPNNLGKVPDKAPVGTNGPYSGGDTGYEFSVSVGHQKLEKLWDWNASVAYKYIESDAVLDALTDSDFHLGGTNAKGYVINANLALHKNAWISGSWLSAGQVSGQPYHVDVLLVDLNAKF